MTQPTSPGAPASDVMAVEQLRTLIEDTTANVSQETEDGEGYQAFALSPEQARAALMDEFPSVVFERDVNSAGVPMRRVVARTEWHVDPAPPAAHVRKGDIVRYVDREKGDRSDWRVISVPFKALDPGESLLFLSLPEWDDELFVNTSARLVTIVSRPANAV